MANMKISPKQREFLQSTSRIVVFVAGIASGKSVIASEKAVQLMLQGGYVLVVSQSYKQLKLVLMHEIQERLRHHNIAFEYNMSDMVLTIPSTGGKSFGFSADAIESCRGVTVDAAILDEAALYPKYVYDVVFGRLRRGKIPLQIYITTTPRGRNNWVYDLCQKSDSHYIKQSTIENPFLPKAFLEQIKLEYSGEFAAQELMGDFVDISSDTQFISSELIKLAQKRIPLTSTEPLIAGLDVARYGGDRSVLVGRQGNTLVNCKTWEGLSLTRLVEQVTEWCVDNGPTYLIVDSCGLGAGVFDMLKDAISNITKVIEYNGAYAANKSDKFANLRMESWSRMKDWISNDGKLTNDEYWFEGCNINIIIDTKGRMMLESKEMMRRQGKSSPDHMDALSFTFSPDAAKKTTTENKKKMLFGSRKFSG